MSGCSLSQKVFTARSVNYSNHPRHICINSKGEIVVADELNQRLQVFDAFDLGPVCTLVF